MKTAITVKGANCKACKTLIEDVCKDVKGVKLCNVDFNTGKTVIEHDEKFNLSLAKKEIESLGSYKAEK